MARRSSLKLVRALTFLGPDHPFPFADFLKFTNREILFMVNGSAFLAFLRLAAVGAASLISCLGAPKLPIS